MYMGVLVSGMRFRKIKLLNADSRRDAEVHGKNVKKRLEETHSSRLSAEASWPPDLPPVCAVERLAFTVRRAHACANDVPVHVDQLFCIHLGLDISE